MGTVYLAREHAAERTVAMKILHSPTNRSIFDRFLIEARVLARLDHPNIIKLIQVETNWREPFLTMEYADGGSLADLVQPGQPLLPPAEAARLILGAAEAIVTAHRAGVLHRDLKPSNILLYADRGRFAEFGHETKVEDGSRSTPATPRFALTPKVSDFGLAKRIDRDDGLTRTGPIGTPGYMSPEAAAGRYRDVAAASDVYGLGATLYQLLTGRPPFTGASVEEVLQKVLSDPPVRPRALRPDLPAGLEAIVVKAMAKNPAARYESAAAMATDLKRFLAGETPVAPVLSPRRRAWQWLVRRRTRIARGVAIVLAAVALLMTGKFFLTTPPSPRDPEQVMRDEIAAGTPVRLLGADGMPRAAGWPLGPAELRSNADDGGTCDFETLDSKVLLLLNDPGVDSYRFRATIREKRKLAHVDQTIDPILSGVGLVFSYAGQNGVNANRVHSMMALSFTEPEAADAPGARRELGLKHVALEGAPGFEGRNAFRVRNTPPVPLRRAEAGGPLWRDVVAEVTPAGVRVPGRNGLQEIDPASIAEARANLQNDVLPRSGPVAFPEWSPRMPLGIWCRGAWVQMRNITIEKLK